MIRLALLMSLSAVLMASELVVWQSGQDLPAVVTEHLATLVDDDGRQVLAIELHRDRPAAVLPWTGWSLTERTPPTGQVSHLLLRLRLEGLGDPRWQLVGPGGDRARQRWLPLSHYAVLDHGRWVDLRLPVVDLVEPGQRPALVLGDPLVALRFDAGPRDSGTYRLLIARIAFITLDDG